MTQQHGWLQAQTNVADNMFSTNLYDSDSDYILQYIQVIISKERNAESKFQMQI